MPVNHSSDQERVSPSEALAHTHHISKRGATNVASRDIWGPREKSMGNPWSPSNPDGTIILRLAENSLMHEEICSHILSEMTVLPQEHLTYSTGPRGSKRLRKAAAALLTERFRSRSPVTYENIIVTPGMASAIDGISFAICDENDGILVPRPLYNGFVFDLMNRSDVQVRGVKYEGIEGFSGLDDLFLPGVNRRALEKALCEAKETGVNIRALLISNPHNPLGRCYPPETLREFALFCGKNDLHLISDEIYAFSGFQNPEAPLLDTFTSILALDLDSSIDPTRKHVLYSASKDFCANGLRMGFVYTVNEGIMGAISSISMFSWSPHMLQDVWAAMMERGHWMDGFMRRKQELMLDRYKMTTAFLSEHGIPYYDMNAGLFLWIDLRHVLCGNPQTQPSDDSSLDGAASDAQPTLQSELDFADLCMKNGLMITPGHVYMSENYGWFRITFTVGREALEEGLKRLLLSIKTTLQERKS